MLSQRTALWALAVIFAANFLNYTDRQLVSALEKPITTDPALELDTEAFGWLWSYFTIGYMICAMPIGLLADRYRRTRIFAVCIAIWSVATVASGLAQTRGVLNVARVFIGVGEAGCLVIGPSLLSDYFTTAVRGRALSVFYLGMSLGGVTAFLLPLALSRMLNWREMFYVAGVPGFVVALLVALLPEPPRGAKEPGAHGPHGYHGADKLAHYVRLLKTPTLLLIILAQAFAVAVLVPLVHFGKKYLEEGRALTEKQAGVSMLGILVAGIVGNLLSGLIGDRMARRVKGAYAQLAGIGYLAALVALYTAFVSEPIEIFLAGLIAGSFFLFLCMPAVNTQIANVTSPQQRGAAWALAVFILHLLGDTAAPPLFGKIEEQIGRQQTFVYFCFALVPAALCCFLATLTARADTERVEREIRAGQAAATAP
ncbi:MAG: MFS transporter [Planctomycetes bacterium]|nr:MFS transporter [Planctomycetota bacterium]